MFNNETFHGYVKGHSDKSDTNILYDAHFKTKSWLHTKSRQIILDPECNRISHCPRNCKIRKISRSVNNVIIFEVKEDSH